MKRIALATVLATVGLAGCATQHEHPELMGRIEAAERAAAQAQQSAAAAQARADEAMAAASANNQKVDRAFKKSMQK